MRCFATAHDTHEGGPVPPQGPSLRQKSRSGFTNLQFIGLSADAAKAGDHTFATMLQSIQTDEARHAQIGTPLITIMIENGRQGRGPAADRYRILAYLEAVLRAQRHLHGLLHAAGVPRAFAQGVHARVGGRSVRPQYQGPGPRPCRGTGTTSSTISRPSTTASRSASTSTARPSGGGLSPASRRPSATGSKRNIRAGTTPTASAGTW